jgi:hypothetical protein
MSKTSIALVTTAVLMAAAAPVVRFVLLPELRQVPANLDLTYNFTGTASLLNASALGSGDITHAFLHDVPVTGTKHVTAKSTHGRTAVLSDRVTVAGPGGGQLFGSNHLWAVDRVDLTARPAPAGSDAETHNGLIAGWPLQPARTGYPFWDTLTQTTTSATYTHTSTLDGRTVYAYTIHASGPVHDTQTLAALPRVLPKTLLAGLSPTLPANQQQVLGQALPSLPANIPLSYDATTDTTVYADTATGLLLDISQKQTVTAELSTPLGPAPLAPVLSVGLNTTPSTVKQLSGKASTSAAQLAIIGILVPIALAALAVILLALVAVSARRRRNQA